MTAGGHNGCGNARDVIPLADLVALGHGEGLSCQCSGCCSGEDALGVTGANGAKGAKHRGVKGCGEYHLCGLSFEFSVGIIGLNSGIFAVWRWRVPVFCAASDVDKASNGRWAGPNKRGGAIDNPRPELCELCGVLSQIYR